MDYEVELCVVIGKTVPRRTTVEDADDFILGYTVAHDVSARDWQVHAQTKFSPRFCGGLIFSSGVCCSSRRTAASGYSARPLTTIPRSVPLPLLPAPGILLYR